MMVRRPAWAGQTEVGAIGDVTVFAEVARSRGHVLEPAAHRPMSRCFIPRPCPPVRLPDVFRLRSLAEDDDLAKVDRVLWRGFDHPGEPPAGDWAPPPSWRASGGVGRVARRWLNADTPFYQAIGWQ
jgi:hypothetical protein